MFYVCWPPTASLGAFLLALDHSLVLDSYPKSKIQDTILLLEYIQMFDLIYIASPFKFIGISL